MNVHVTVRPTRWWRDTLGRSWDAEFEGRIVAEDAESCTLFFQRRAAASSA